MSPLSFHSGCDGKDYSNPCGAWSMGVSVSHMGECRVFPEEGGVVVAETSDKTLNSAEGTDASAASDLSTLSFVTAVVAATVCATLFFCVMIVARRRLF